MLRLSTIFVSALSDLVLLKINAKNISILMEILTLISSYIPRSKDTVRCALLLSDPYPLTYQHEEHLNERADRIMYLSNSFK